MKNQNSVFDKSDLPRTQSGDTPVPGKWEPKLPKDERNAVINIYGSHSTAEAAVEELQHYEHLGLSTRFKRIPQPRASSV